MVTAPVKAFVPIAFVIAKVANVPFVPSPIVVVPLTVHANPPATLNVAPSLTVRLPVTVLAAPSVHVLVPVPEIIK